MSLIMTTRKSQYLMANKTMMTYSTFASEIGLEEEEVTWKGHLIRSLIALLLLLASTGIYFYSLQTCPYSYDDPND